MAERMKALGEPSFWSPPEDATPEQVTEWETFSRPGCSSRTRSITAWVDVADVLDQRWDAIKAHVTQISEDNPFMRFGKDAWAEFWRKEASSAASARIPAPDQETDLFEGLADATPGAAMGAGAPAVSHDRGPVITRRGRGAPAGIRRSRRRTGR